MEWKHSCCDASVISWRSIDINRGRELIVATSRISDATLDSLPLTGIQFWLTKKKRREPERFLSHMHSGASLLSRISSFCIHTCHKRWKTVADRGAHLFEHEHHRLLGLAENLSGSSCVSSRFQSECTYLFWGVSAPFQPLIVVFFTYASVINTPTHFSECCSGGLHAAQTRARTAELHPDFNKIYTHTSPPAKMTIKSGLCHMCNRVSVRNTTCSAQHNRNTVKLSP